MTIKIKDANRAALVQVIIKQNGGKIFTVIAKRKAPKVSYQRLGVVQVGLDEAAVVESLKPAQYNKLTELEQSLCTKVVENFMEMTCRTGVTKELKGGKSTIRDTPDLISVNLTNGQGYRCFSAFNVLELRASGTIINFKEADILAFTG